LGIQGGAGGTMFQSTPFARRETGCLEKEIERKPFQSTPFARRETTGLYLYTKKDAPFQSTPFARRETKWLGLQNIPGTVSIHSLRKKGDLF